MRAVKARTLASIATAKLTPLEVVQARMAGEDVDELQYRAALELLPYTTPRLSAIAVASAGTKTLEDLLREAGEIRRRKVLTIDGSHSGTLVTHAPAATASVENGQIRQEYGIGDNATALIARAKELLPTVTDPAQRAELEALIKRAERP